MSAFLRNLSHNSRSLTAAVFLLLLSACGGLSASNKGSSETAKKSSNGVTNIDVLNTDSNHTIRMAWEGVVEESKVLSGYSVEADKRGDLGVYCFANETDCREAASEIRNAVVGGAAYRDNPVAIQALEMQFNPAVTSFTIEVVTARPVMKATTSDASTASRSEVWFRDMHVLTYTYNNGTKSLTASSSGSTSCGSGDFGFQPTVSSTYNVPASGSESAFTIYRGPRIFTGFGFVDHGTKQSNTSSQVYYYGRFGWAKVYHLGMAPSATGSKFNPTFLPTAISTGSSNTAPSATMGEGKNSNPVHQIGWNFYSGSRPTKYQHHLIVGMCLKGTPMMGAFFRTNLFSLKDCNMESCGK